MWLFLWFSLAHRAWHFRCYARLVICFATCIQATSLLLNSAVRLRYMKKWNYNRTDTMPISYTIIMIRSVGANLPPECSGIWQWKHSVIQMWISGNWELLRLYVSSKTRLAWLMQSSLQQCLEYNTIVAVFLNVLLLVYQSLSLSLILIPQKSAYYLTFPFDTWQSQIVCLEQQLWQFRWHYGF